MMISFSLTRLHYGADLTLHQNLSLALILLLWTYVNIIHP
jgi:hypothetical protein